MQKPFKSGGPFLILLSAAAVLFFSSCETQAKKPAGDKDKYIIPDTIMKSLTIDTVSVSQLVNAITLTGKVGTNDDRVVPVYSLVSGIVQDIKVVLGDYVTAGQVLATVRSQEMAQYSSDLLNAETNLRIAQTNLRKTIDMYHGGLASMPDSLNAEVAVQQAQAELDRVHRVLKINGGNSQGEFVVRAPISGFIVQKGATNNMTIRGDNSTSIFTISDLKDVWIQANVYESNISHIRLGENVDVTTLAYPGKVFKGKVDKIMNVLDPSSKVMKVRVVLPNENYALKPEMYASITVNDKENRQCLSVPSGAVIFDHSQYYVLIFHSKSDVKITPIQVINAVGDKTLIASGVNEGDKVISSQALLIYDALNS
ncbi:efflux RND transporter periplasmic adaptor subunit [Puia dinghuensis]|uniref:Hemolysin D n=1 Tax=Puia dinghuensis TaxID=1792502 RepID=A0A8J2U9K8_9BACT|nr:efflux RND transporter periplasmic adaptor subunit [Puia dinghuensis]GGA88104.1 hemolysin D [Puia dinghuensis]